MQQPGSMFPVMPSFPPTNITTEQIQRVFISPSFFIAANFWGLAYYLDENKKLILAILDNQNLGKLAECAQYQAQLQKNLMYLAAIADAQPQTPAMPPQMSPHPAMQQGGFYMQHPQAAAMAQQFPPRPPFNNPHSMHDMQQHLHNQPHMQGNPAQMTMRPVGPTNGVHPPHNDTNLGPNSNAGNRQQDKPDAGAAATPDGQGQGNTTAVAHGGGDGDETK
ncbi:hypothetical protein BUALT_Bualt01G0244800 [Buddleja alternifolia]|uniref:SS18 N-terminal domain-containing protein n=1 Tax=Buddleja alternifolia TaxID=168488 RepID=A0AAV6YHH1_9LAMI|nr:hypothetical protein BUALT_Bualt01G0244800 [Buddleja alternifolia]